MNSPNNRNSPRGGDTATDQLSVSVVHENLRPLSEGDNVREITGPTGMFESNSKMRITIIFGGGLFTCPGAKEGSLIEKGVYDGDVYYLDAGSRYCYVPTEDFLAVREQELADSFEFPENPKRADPVQ